MKTKLAVMILGMSMAAPALAASVDQRVNRQQQRIGQGVATGQLTAQEAARLEAKEVRLQQRIAQDKADGRGFTARERTRIQRQQNHLSRQIYLQKHDRQAR